MQIFRDYKVLAKAMKKIVDKYKKYETEGDSIPSAPNSAIFRATRSGTIDLVSNTDSKYLLAVLIGGAIPYQIKHKISSEIENLVRNFKDNDESYYSWRDGTNYSTVGLMNPKIKFNEKYEHEIDVILGNKKRTDKFSYRYTTLERELKTNLYSNFHPKNFKFSSSNWRVGHPDGSMSLYVVTEDQNFNLKKFVIILKAFARKQKLYLLVRDSVNLRKGYGNTYECSFELTTVNNSRVANRDYWKDYKILFAPK